MALVRLERVTKEYRLGRSTVQAVKGIDLAIEAGEFLALAGPSGSGKTTLLNLISGIERPTAGHVLVEEVDVGGLTSDQLAELRASQIGFIFQHFNLLPVLTALENVEYPLLTRRMPAAERRRRAQEALDRVGLARFGRHKPLELSGGQMQRVAIARAMVTDAPIVLADEPTANLDHQTGQEILRLMKTLNQERRTTFIFSTHDQKIIDLAGRVVRLWDGQLTNHAA